MAYQTSTGFDYYTTATQWWDTVTGTPTISSGSARFTGTHSQGVSVAQNSRLLKNLSASVTTPIMGLAVNFTHLPAANDSFMAFYDSASFQCGLVVTPAGGLQFIRGSGANPSTLIGVASSSGLIAAGVWNYIEMQATINNATGVVQAWVNGTQVINSTGVNNRGSTNNSANQIGIGEFTNTGGAVPILFDDLYCLDVTGVAPTGVLGDTRIITIMPAATGSFSDFTPIGDTPNWRCVDEIPADDDTTYVSSGTVNNRDSYGYEQVTLTGNPNLVVPWGRVKKDDAGSHTVQLSVRNGGNDAFSPSFSVPSSYIYFNGGAFTTNPNGGGIWDQTGINSTEFGIKIIT